VKKREFVTILSMACAVLILLFSAQVVLADGPCDNADFLREIKSTDEAKEAYIALLANPEAVDCAKAGLRALAATPASL